MNSHQISHCKGIAKNTLTYSIIFLLLLSATSCKKFLETELPPSKIPSEFVFTNDVTATSAVTGLYVEMLSQDNFARGDQKSVSTLGGLSSDELLNLPQNPAFVQFEQNNLLPQNANLLTLWVSMYRIIYMANAILEGLAESTGMTEATKKQLEGEALFVRAFTYFNLINLFGDAPLITTTDYLANSTPNRTPVASIYAQIKTDLLRSQTLLTDAYVNISSAFAERVRPNKATATALLSRVYLYNQEWANSETEATSVINNTLYGLEPVLNNVFLKGSKEAIWQLRPILATGVNTWEGNVFVINANGHQNSYMNDQLRNSFELNDNRKTNWIGSYTTTTTPITTYYFPNKYKVKQATANSTLTEYSIVFRLAEQYLIRAEARAQLGNLSNAIKDVDSVRKRAGLPLIKNTNPGISQANLLLAIEKERRVELFTEWGHRWFDLKRTSRATAVLGPIKTGWNPDDVLYPLPQVEMDKNPNLRPQNPGY